ncbi:MAG: ribosomal L7Ae/L30e/S12e/Gadd45 family protein [Nanoarchaeota archaeon]|nr:ribosomal L7Ae/L30e/S12e/Gadd45 family protein [Nanoarchaeota archaeon]
MSVKEISEAIESGKISFGIRQCLKIGKKAKNVFIAKDTRDETVEKLEVAKIEFIVLKSKAELAKELNLDFECEVFCLHQNGVPHKGAK